MFVSVVLPTYHRASVLGDAVESVLGQTHDDLELLVVDDGDDDATPELVSSFDDDRLRYVRRDESARRDDSAGVSSARNEGVRRTDGDVVAFVDSDDRWHPDKLRRQVRALRQAGDADDGPSSDEYGVVYAPVTKRDGEPRTRECASGDVFEAVRTMSVPTYTSTLLVRREAFEQVGGFDERLGCFEDWDLCLRLARDWRFECVDAPLVLKGTEAGNVSADPDRLARSVERLFEVHDLPDEARARLLADAGTTYCEAGRLAEGRPYLRRALGLDFRPNAAAALALSLSASPRAFDAGMGAVYGVEQLLAGRG
ncbi:glycosyltransferase family A protein [Halorussus sp. MSC15.2]|uniref:glycosyltransferase family 2 protein n=1 Tax=Halorussus sp. MSC15.2 TaxID=2283638 RepID=UPI0013D5865B|nr:glycosyltransferase family A protein [Halorussus sp. MSC15.2]NEU56556.1 glycosyltransferase family 2 protein [Halorussus sp. MSC15.2]